jgi:hypothetical protein
LGREDVRLLTLTGPPGVGKTRLALELARCLREDFANQVVYVALASVRNPDLVIGAVARSLGVEEHGNRPLIEGVKTHLRPRKLLLVLDNFEQVLSAGRMIADLLANCPGLSGTRRANRTDLPVSRRSAAGNRIGSGTRAGAAARGAGVVLVPARIRQSGNPLAGGRLGAERFSVELEFRSVYRTTGQMPVRHRSAGLCPG